MVEKHVFDFVFQKCGLFSFDILLWTSRWCSWVLSHGNDMTGLMWWSHCMPGCWDKSHSLFVTQRSHSHTFSNRKDYVFIPNPTIGRSLVKSSYEGNLFPAHRARMGGFVTKTKRENLIPYVHLPDVITDLLNVGYTKRFSWYSRQLVNKPSNLLG